VFRGVKTLVTGGAGFIGSNLVDALIARGDEVAILDDLSTGRRENVDDACARGAKLHEIDIADASAVDAIVRAERPEVIFHLAAQIDVRRSVEDPAADARINVEGTVNLLEAARASGRPRIVLSSTGGAIYGDADALPTDESAAIRPLSPYGQAKFAAEGYCELFASLHGLSTIALRYANVYGPRQDPLGEGGVIAIFCGKLASGQPPVIFGDGRQTRDYVFVGDVVEANLRAAGSTQRGAFNVGTGVETSVLDLVEALRELGEDAATFEPRYAPPRAGEVHRSCLDPARIERVLGWRARTDLRTGLRRTLEQVVSL